MKEKNTQFSRKKKENKLQYIAKSLKITRLLGSNLIFVDFILIKYSILTTFILYFVFWTKYHYMNK